MTSRREALGVMHKLLLPRIAKPYEIQPDELQLCPEHDGCQSLFSLYRRDADERVLRLSFREGLSGPQPAAYRRHSIRCVGGLRLAARNRSSAASRVTRSDLRPR
jgi:hypothetical protein